MKKVVITGGLSSGKSTVCQFLKELGAYVVKADEIVHNLLSSSASIRNQVIDLLGPDVVVNDKLDRQIIAEKVFSHPETLKSLEQILHPAVFHEIESQYQAVKNDPNYLLFVAEVPLLYETHSESLFDFVIVVTAEENLCKKRFEAKTGLQKKEFTKRMLRQMPPEEKIKRADFVLENKGRLEELKENVLKLINKLRAT